MDDNRRSSDEEPGFNISEDLVQSPTHKAAGTTVIDFDGLLSTPLRLHEDLAGGCGGQLWPAGMVLGRYMLQRHGGDLEDKTIVELGAGGGLVGLAVALGCRLTKPLYITDQLPMLALMQQNVILNGLQSQVIPDILDWGSDTISSDYSKPDIILAADCVYFEPAFPLLQMTLQRLVGPNTVVYFCFKKRRRADMQFMKTARKLFDVKEVEDDPHRSEYARENIHL